MNNESDLTKAIAEKFGITQKLADEIEDFSQRWKMETTRDLGKAKLHKYGSFVKKEVKGSERKNLKTGETYFSEDSVSVTFKPSKLSRDILNGRA